MSEDGHISNSLQLLSMAGPKVKHNRWLEEDNEPHSRLSEIILRFMEGKPCILGVPYRYKSNQSPQNTSDTGRDKSERCDVGAE